MTPILPLELQQYVAISGSNSVRMMDPNTQKVYVLISSEELDSLYEKTSIKTMKKEEQVYAIRAAGARAEWDDPSMDVYDNYDFYRSQIS